MIDNEYYIAAFAAFLFSRHTRLCAILCIGYMSVEWYAYKLPNEAPDYLFQYYYISIAVFSVLACHILKKCKTNDQTIIFMILFFVCIFQELYGFLLYTYDQEPETYNFMGDCIIMSFIIALWMTRNGKLENIIDMSDIFTRLCTYLQNDKSKRA